MDNKPTNQQADNETNVGENKYFRKQKEKETELKSVQRKKSLKKAAVFTIYILIFGTGVLGFLKFINKDSGPVPGEFFEAQSRSHISPNEKHPPYNSNPPTGGWHYSSPIQTGIYGVELTDEQVVHNLEHGHIWITHIPDLPQDQIETLADIAKSFGSRIVMSPRSKNDSPIAIAAWEHLLKLDNVDEAQINLFIKAYKNIAGPERNIPDFGFDDFRSN